MEIPKKMLKYYHGTSVPNLQTFKLGVKGKGECADPISGVWLASDRQGAAWHACSRIKGISTGYVYRASISGDAIIGDTQKSQFPPAAYARHRKSLNWFCRPFSRDKNWYSTLYKQAKNHLKTVNPSSEAITEEIIRRCRKLGIDGILNPVVNVQNNKCQDYNETKYGTSLLLINLDVVQSLKRVDELKVV